MPIWKISLLILLIVPGLSPAENWPGWRGPRGDGSSTETTLPLQWDATKNENIAWRTAVPYAGHSSPIVWDNRIFVTGADEIQQRRMLLMFDRTSGALLWEREVAKSPLGRKHKLNSWASGTPATDGRRVYVAFLEGHEMLITAFDLEGLKQWTVRPGVFSSVHGYASCPVLFENLVIVNGDHDGEAYLVALDRETGQTIWKTPRDNKTRSYCTPLIRDIDGRTQMILSGSKCVASYDPRTGQRHWILNGPTQQFVASPVMNKGLVLITGGYPDKHILAIDPRGSGQITEESHVKWHHLNKGVSYIPSPVAADIFFYCVSDGGVASCFDAVTGQVIWQERLGRRHTASLVATESHVYSLDDDGITHVFKTGSEFKVVATNPLGEASSSSPATTNNQILIRGEKHLFCISRSNDKTTNSNCD